MSHRKMLEERKEELRAQIEPLQKELDEIDSEIKTHAEDLLKKYAAFKIQGHNVSIESVERVGQIDYSKIKELSEINLELYRKPKTRFVQIKIKK
jgi:vacuolar-type H+-ATPase subunit D/Vma8